MYRAYESNETRPDEVETPAYGERTYRALQDLEEIGISIKEKMINRNKINDGRNKVIESKTFDLRKINDIVMNPIPVIG